MAEFVDPIVTAQIVAAKDKLVVEANRAEVIVDQWYATGNLVQDAPSDGKSYNRKDATWVEASSGGGSGDMVKATYDPQNINSDAFARANHTGTQAIGTVTGLNTALDSKVSEAPIDAKLYGRKNATWEEIPASSGVTIPEVFTPVKVTTGIPTTVANWRGIEAGKYEYEWSGFDFPSAVLGFPFAGDSDSPNRMYTWFVEVQDLPAAEKYLIVSRRGKVGIWTLDTTGKTGTDDAQDVYQVAAPRSVLDLADVITTNLASNVGKVLTVFSATEVAFLNPVAGATNLSNVPAATTVAVNSSSGTGTTLPAATTSLAGVMTGADKVKLNSIASGAEVNVQSDWNAASGDAQILNKPAIIPEAPSDGKQYARKNAAWEEVASSGGGGEVPTWEWGNETLPQLTNNGADWGSRFLAAVKAKQPTVAGRINKFWQQQFAGTGTAQPFTVPTPAQMGFSQGMSWGLVLAEGTMMNISVTSVINVNTDPRNVLTGVTWLTLAEKLHVPQNTITAGSNQRVLLKLTARNPFGINNGTGLSWQVQVV